MRPGMSAGLRGLTTGDQSAVGHDRRLPAPAQVRPATTRQASSNPASSRPHRRRLRPSDYEYSTGRPTRGGSIFLPNHFSNEA
jgi:hypothetical protein